MDDRSLTSLLATDDDVDSSATLADVLLKLAQAGLIVRTMGDDGWQLTEAGQAMIDKQQAPKQ